MQCFQMRRVLWARSLIMIAFPSEAYIRTSREALKYIQDIEALSNTVKNSDIKLKNIIRQVLL